MMPSIDDRLGSMARAVQEAILPALDSTQSLAIEQAQLLLAHIAMIRCQLDFAPDFERTEAAELASLARELLQEGQGGAMTMAACQALNSALSAATFDQIADVRRTTASLGDAIEALIDASGTDGDASFKEASFKKVIDAGRIAATRDRSWFQPAGFEAVDVQLPSAASVI